MGTSRARETIKREVNTSMTSYKLPKMGHLEKIHFVGIGGVGMCGIAEVLFHEGYTVTGSDKVESKMVKYLRSLGIKVSIGHQVSNIQGADVVVKSSAVTDDNPEIQAAKKTLIPVIPRAAMLAELMRFRQGIAIAGTHGKTTTTSLVSSLLAEGGLDPSFVIGGKLNSLGSNAKLGTSPYFVAEADESDASFLFLKPMMAVVTNIDADHMGAYEDDFNKLRQTFVEFLHHLPFYGAAVLCIDCKEVKSILPLIERPIIRYGFDDKADVKAYDWQQKGMKSLFKVRRPHPHGDLEVCFKLPGRHNVLNALAAIAIATELGVKDDAIILSLAQFQGVGRRFQILGERQFEQGKALIIDDYGHHPSEVKSTIEAVRCVWPEKRLIHVFQPHRYSRTQALFNDFVNALSTADEVRLLGIYSAGEDKIDGISSKELSSVIKTINPNCNDLNDKELVRELDAMVQDGDVILMQGAGSIGQMALELFQLEQENV
jgi:UDP-N-acetylmuramate--alanine ligase